MNRFLYFVLLFLSCNNRNSSSLEFLINHEISQLPKAFFSYPGKYVSEEKKRNVLQRILEIIRTTESDLVIYAYSLNNKEIIDEIQKAKDRGVRLHIVLDKDKKYEYIESKNIPYLIWRGSGLHHLKIIISDKKCLFLGTGNFSEVGLTHDLNGYIELPVTYEFYEKFFRHLNTQSPDVNLSNHGIQFLFSPENGNLIQDSILGELENARHTIQILTFDHYDEIFSHVVRKKSSQGLKIEMIYNDPVDPEGLYLNKYFLGYNSTIYRDGNIDTVNTGNFNEGGLLHHKTILIDNRVLLTGSYNFSLNAKKNNREIYLRTENPVLVHEFQKEFERIRASSYTEEFRPRAISFQPIDVVPISEKDRVCTEERVGSSTLEIGNGIFKTYLRYSRLAPNTCFKYSSPEEISSGITEFSEEKALESGFLWKDIRIYPRFSEKVYKSQAEESFPHASGVLFVPLKKIYTTELGKYRFQFQAEEFSPNSLKLYSPGRELMHAVLFKEGIEYLAEVPELGGLTQGLIFLESEGRQYVSCFCRTKKNCSTTLYLLNKINFARMESNQCLNF